MQTFIGEVRAACVTEVVNVSAVNARPARLSRRRQLGRTFKRRQRSELARSPPWDQLLWSELTGAAVGVYLERQTFSRRNSHDRPVR
jgi:hypothetical protein